MVSKTVSSKLQKRDVEKIVEFLSRVVPRGPQDQAELESVLRLLAGMI